MVGVTETEVSVVNLAELTLGVLMAGDAERAARVPTLSAVESTWDPLPVDAEVARQFARVAAELRGRRREYRSSTHLWRPPLRWSRSLSSLEVVTTTRFEGLKSFELDRLDPFARLQEPAHPGPKLSV